VSVAALRDAFGVNTNLSGRKLRLCLLAISLSSVKNLLYVAMSLLGSKENTNGNITSPTNPLMVNIWSNIGEDV